MTMPVHVSASADRAYELVLPGTWASIPLDTPENARAAAQRLARERIGRDDRLASLRRQTRDELVKTAAEAALAGADGLWLSLEILPGIPLPASMITSWRVWGPPPADQDLRARLTGYRPAGEVVDTTLGPVIRTRATGISRLDESKQSLALEYVVPTPVAHVVLVVDASAPLIDEREPYTALFDSIVDSLRWGPMEPAR